VVGLQRSELFTRRLPPPWSIEELNDACFIVRDSAGQQLAYVYFEEEPGRRSAAKLLTRDKARRIAANVAKLLELLGTYDASAERGPTGQKNGTNERCAITPIPFEIAHTHTSGLLFV
jgi:hypothetical protein